MAIKILYTQQDDNSGHSMPECRSAAFRPCFAEAATRRQARRHVTSDKKIINT